MARITITLPSHSTHSPMKLALQGKDNDDLSPTHSYTHSRTRPPSLLFTARMTMTQPVLPASAPPAAFPLPFEGVKPCIIAQRIHQRHKKRLRHRKIRKVKRSQPGSVSGTGREKKWVGRWVDRCGEIVAHQCRGQGMVQGAEGPHYRLHLPHILASIAEQRQTESKTDRQTAILKDREWNDTPFISLTHSHTERQRRNDMPF